jgi:hypothetical protein
VAVGNSKHDHIMAKYNNQQKKKLKRKKETLTAVGT